MASEPLTIGARLDEVATAHAHRPALRHRDGWLTHAEAERRASTLARHLRDRGVAPGDRVVIALRNTAALRLAEHAVWKRGAVRVSLTPRLHPAEIAAIAEDCSAMVVLCEADAVDAVRAHAPGHTVIVPRGDLLAPAPAPLPAEAVAADDTAMLLYSSGTTGRPKGVEVTHRMWAAQLAAVHRQLPPLRATDVVAVAAPMAHFAGSISLDYALSGAATVPVATFDPRALLRLAAELRVTVLPLVPVLLTALAREQLRDPVPLPALRAVVYGGSSIAAPDAEAAVAAFPDVLHQFYGLAEALAPVTALTPADHHDGALRRTAGRFTGLAEHRIVDGELRLRGAAVAAGYHGDPERSRAAFDDDGWYRTGDLVAVHASGGVEIVGRRSDTIITGGFNVSPGEVEAVLRELPGIADVAVAGVAHERWGEGVSAFLVLDHDGRRRHPTAESLHAAVDTACRRQLAAYKTPVHAWAIDELPRNAAGKIDRRCLRAAAETAIAAGRIDGPLHL